MDAHFMEYHIHHRRTAIQRELRAIRLEREATSQRTGQRLWVVSLLMSVLRAPFGLIQALRSRRANPSRAVTSPRRAAKLA